METPQQDCWRARDPSLCEVLPSPWAHAHPLEFSQGPAHANDKLVEAPQLLQQYHRGGCDVQAQVLPNLVQVKDLGHLVLNVFGHLANVVITADAAAGLPWKDDDVLRDLEDGALEAPSFLEKLPTSTGSALCPQAT